MRHEAFCSDRLLTSELSIFIYKCHRLRGIKFLRALSNHLSSNDSLSLKLCEEFFMRHEAFCSDRYVAIRTKYLNIK